MRLAWSRVNWLAFVGTVREDPGVKERERMLNTILPQVADNSYRGHGLATWILVLIVVLKTGTAVTSLAIGSLTLQGAHRVSSGVLPPEAVRLLVLFLERSAFSSLVLVLFCVVVLTRYRALIPLAYVSMLLDHAGRAFFVLGEAAVTGTSSATVVSFVLLGLSVIGLVLSLL